MVLYMGRSGRGSWVVGLAGLRYSLATLNQVISHRVPGA
jgi:hypothetical protein